IETYSDILGIRNYAMARLLTKDELKLFPDESKDLKEGVLYLQLYHTPSLTYPQPILNRSGISIPAYSTIIPLQQHHLDALMNNLYTTRFIVTDGKAKAYGESGSRGEGPNFQGVPDGTYEFYFGKGSSIHLTGISTSVDSNNPLYSRSPVNIQKLFNLGIDMNIAFNPTAKTPYLLPRRYAYFRDGDLYVMGTPILKKKIQHYQIFKKEKKHVKVIAVNKLHT
ncbi:MAG: hypothetical protein O7D30_09175, partial [Rickettsia endosymbiont of Ixodes persulcatus]|nr:hypothetical protein [Rickettsia endosymbiont of Ixodes persulcatus]